MSDLRSKSAGRAPVIVKSNAATTAAPAKKPAAAPVAKAPERWGAPTADAKPASDGFQTGKAAGKAANKGPLITSNEQQVDLRDPASRKEIALEATQVNDVSLAAGNADDICGGASLASALVLASSTPEAAQANGSAMRNLVGARVLSAKNLPTGVNPQAFNTALDHLEKGTLSRNDLFHLQQGLYAAAQSYARKPGDTAAGVGVGQMAAIVAELKGRGASLGSAAMVEVELAKGPPVSSHWVADTKEGLINTGGAKVTADWLSPGSPRFSGDVRVGADVKFRTAVVVDSADQRHRAPRGQGWSASLTPKDPNDIKAALTIPSFDEQLARAAASFDPKKPHPLE